MKWSCGLLLAAGRFDARGLLLAGAILLAILVVAFVVLVLIQRKLDPRRQSKEGSSDGLSLEKIDEMHGRGLISDEEYRSMRRMVMVSMGATPKEESPAAPPGAAPVDPPAEGKAGDGKGGESPTPPVQPDA